MASRRDQVQSYQFFVQRMTSALVAREPDPDAAPFRRLGGAGLGGIMIAVLCLAAVGVYGLVRPGGSTSWKDGASVIVEKETGTRYVYRDGQLHNPGRHHPAYRRFRPDGKLKYELFYTHGLLHDPGANTPEDTTGVVFHRMWRPPVKG